MAEIAISGDIFFGNLKRLFEKEALEHYEENQVKAEILQCIREHDEQREYRSVMSMLLDLYGHDYEALRRDVAKVVLLSSGFEIPRQERVKVLRVLLSTVIRHDDISIIMDECERVISYREEFPDSRYLPFV